MLYIEIDIFIQRQQDRISGKRDIELYYEGLVYVIMEADKSQYPLSAI